MGLNYIIWNWTGPNASGWGGAATESFSAAEAWGDSPIIRTNLVRSSGRNCALKRSVAARPRATQWADFAVITDQLWSTITAIFTCVALSCQDCSLPLIFVYYCQPQKRKKRKTKTRHFDFLYHELVQSWFASMPSADLVFTCFPKRLLLGWSLDCPTKHWELHIGMLHI